MSIFSQPERCRHCDTISPSPCVNCGKDFDHRTYTIMENSKASDEVWLEAMNNIANKGWKFFAFREFAEELITLNYHLLPKPKRRKYHLLPKWEKMPVENT